MHSTTQRWHSGLAVAAVLATLVGTSRLSATVFQVQEATDINPDGDSHPYDMVVYQDTLFFRATGPDGRGLFRTDGQSVNQVPLKPAAPAGGSTLTEYAGELYFAAEGPDGVELYRTDGINVMQVADINPTGDSNPGQLTEFAGELFFSAQGPHGIELFKTDGRL